MRLNSKIKNEKGLTGVDISIAVVILFIFVSLIAFLTYSINSTSKEMELKNDATNIAIDELEYLKTKTFTELDEMTDEDKATKEIKTGFYRTIEITDAADLEGGSNRIRNIVKQITVNVKYMFKGKEQTVTLSTIVKNQSI